MLHLLGTRLYGGLVLAHLWIVEYTEDWLCLSWTVECMEDWYWICSEL